MGAVEVEAIPETPENEEYLASLGLTSSVKGDYLPNGTKYTIKAFRISKNDRIFEKEQTFTVGDSNSEIKLHHGQYYDLVITSEGINIPPTIGDERDPGLVRILNDNRLFQEIDYFMPDRNKKNEINIKLRYCSTGIRIILDSSDILGGNMGKNITRIRSSKIEYYKKLYPHYTYLRFSSLGKSVISSDYEVYIHTSDSYNIIHKTEVEVEFNMYFEVEDLFGEQRIKAKLSIYPGHRYTFILRLMRCGMRSKRSWRQFMCHNLGADYSLDPFTPRKEIHGDKYQWGYSYPIVKQKDNIYTGSIPNWNQVEKADTWDKGIDDPCPSGYRIPSYKELKEFFSPYENVEDWQRVGNSNYYSDGYMFGDNLMLPFARAFDHLGNIYKKPNSEHRDDNFTFAYHGIDGMLHIKYGTKGTIYPIKYGDKEVLEETKNIAKLDAYPIRCIKKR